MGLAKAIQPHENDVLCGRGGYINSHPGNERFRELVEKRKRVYLAARFKQEKRLVANSIVSDIRDIEGRFLAKNNNTGEWYDIGDEKARDKTSQALRENAPTIRAEITEGANQLRSKKPTSKKGTSVKKKTTNSAPSKTKSKKGRKEPSIPSSETASRGHPEYWPHQTNPYYQQPCHYFPPHGYAPYVPPTHPFGSSGGNHPGHPLQLGQRPDHPTSSIPTPVPFSKDNDSHQTTDCVMSSAEAPIPSQSLESPWPGSKRSNSTISANDNYHRSGREDRNWKQSDSDVSQSVHKDSALLRQAANQIMGWDSNTRAFEDPMEEEIGQEVELVDMDYQQGDEHRAHNDSQMMAPPPARPRSRKVDTDWSNILGCQSGWLPDSFASPSPNNNVPSSSSFDMDGTTMGIEGGTSFTGSSFGGNSICNAFSQDQILDGGTVSLSKVHSLASSAQSLSHQDSFKMSPSWDHTVTHSDRCRSPISDHSLASKGSGFECQISPVATSSSNITRLHSRSRSSGSRSCRRKVAPYDGGFH